MRHSTMSNESRVTFRILMSVLTLLVIFVAAAAVQAGNESDGKSNPEYYSMLREACGGDICCLYSAERMEAGGFHLARNSQCEAPEVMGMAGCSGSFRWCEMETQK